ncbi:MAG: lipoyl synthase [Actinomycetota bacterium]|nr:lipoyl synthase [Actinomycetota bacterium]
MKPLRIRWLGRVRYQEALDLQHAIRDTRNGDYLLLLEHPHVYTLGVRTRPEHLLRGVRSSGAEVVRADRGGDVTYHGPGQLVGYPVLDVPVGPGSVPAYVRAIEQLVIDVCADLGLAGCGRLEGYPGVWVEPDGARPRKICAIGVRVDRGRSMHGFALNVDTDLDMFAHIVPCGIADKGVTSLVREGVRVTMRDVVAALCRRAPAQLSFGPGERYVERSVERSVEIQEAAWRTRDPKDKAAGSRHAGTRETAQSHARPLERRLVAAGIDPTAGIAFSARKPPYLRAPVKLGAEVLSLRSTVRDLELVTVCEEAGCPNLSECWSQGTATFMINGERCTRACGFCLVDTRHPLPLDPGEPEHVADAVARLGLSHAVVTGVARDDLADGGAAAFALTVEAIRRRSPATAVEVLIPDCKGDEAAQAAVFSSRPDVLNHNIETVLRLQRAVRTSASYARSLSLLARAKAAGLVTKSGMILGLGETLPEIHATLFDLRSVGVDIVTVGQYLRPSAAHLAVQRWWLPEEFAEIAEVGTAMGFLHVESSPLTRSSYHAREAASRASRAGEMVVGA